MCYFPHIRCFKNVAKIEKFGFPFYAFEWCVEPQKNVLLRR